MSRVGGLPPRFGRNPKGGVKLLLLHVSNHSIAAAVTRPPLMVFAAIGLISPELVMAPPIAKAGACASAVDAADRLLAP
ncbi:hypothetical protein [Mesorhizobium sp. WSM3860]|uniref:hypothetical protein n=1 Tax=Mesorhizobium sp. WSM3860 TaxID=2029403 RepID=UPI0011409A4C|nr:hypothetical protein [Mesorhizobium sp. WSM3860]